jgi:hypothetical protein
VAAGVASPSMMVPLTMVGGAWGNTTGDGEFGCYVLFREVVGEGVGGPLPESDQPLKSDDSAAFPSCVTVRDDGSPTERWAAAKLAELLALPLAATAPSRAHPLPTE